MVIAHLRKMATFFCLSTMAIAVLHQTLHLTTPIAALPTRSIQIIRLRVMTTSLPSQAELRDRFKYGFGTQVFGLMKTTQQITTLVFQTIHSQQPWTPFTVCTTQTIRMLKMTTSFWITTDM